MLMGLETKLFYLINKTCANPIFDFLMPIMSEVGSGEALFAISFILLLRKKKENRMAGILLLAGLSATYYFVYLLKSWVARPRPFMVLPDVRMFIDEKSFSFPSTHAAHAFLAAAILSKFFKRYVIFFTLAIIVGFSRIYMGVHFFSDVIAGAILGMVVGYILVRVVKNEV